ncbi:50S ribosomal protein L4 [Candidatus Uhrbacteria bacterium CG_4_9_14_3_um_filter_41_35]|uniref:Large ribosomal subunit protein uL4 n=1 Tax=Candidatus Uhrbacteria bacterium CG_4_9_14_3_um_filter_41_35 TaxID=1975034 RepID=A0A2M7XG61_9BACT|nr:MAG: 50S ribosomal protein L4 [Candidatus Uhrbacteria bacterium CG11_big_fil_rev_8_21_14_0_20_41_9]PJA46842.1 MAG: 50S ribosomal protein L4 [Candidatus Uhrbacteria bacterium CG_4_9_14_3_um_filter_41_35]
MAEVTLYKTDGTNSGKIALPDELFAVAVKPYVVHEVITAQLANSRVRYAQTKDRSEVRGGGKKPWKQKGTGRARHGSSRSPIWSGGGVTFGPVAARNFSKKVNKKLRRNAILMMLSDKVLSDKLVTLDAYDVEAKTSSLAQMRKALPGDGRSALIVTTGNDLNTIRAASNLPKTRSISARSLNARDLAKYEYLFVSKEAIDVIKETYTA